MSFINAETRTVPMITTDWSAIVNNGLFLHAAQCAYDKRMSKTKKARLNEALLQHSIKQDRKKIVLELDYVVEKRKKQRDGTMIFWAVGPSGLVKLFNPEIKSVTEYGNDGNPVYRMRHTVGQVKYL